MITTEAWVLHQSTSDDSGQAELRREEFAFSPITDEEVLAEPLYGCWEANMTHALKRHPVDVCQLRREKRIVLGNAGVVRIVETGKAVSTVKEGDICAIIPVGQLDRHGYMMRVFGYDAPNTIGMLARRTKLHEKQIYRLPLDTKYSLQQWAAFSVRYATAWDNWKVAYSCLRSQLSEDDAPAPHVWAWGGGVALAELSLAKKFGCQVAMISSHDDRLKLIEAMGITPIDRRQFPGLDYDEERYRSDRPYRARYLSTERKFMDIVRDKTSGEGVSIFIDNIGRPVWRATLKALARQGVITTVGWDQGERLTINRINECINRHIYVQTHGARYAEGEASARFAEANGWMPPVDSTVFGWDEIPKLVEDFASGKISSYFPIFQINAL
jgi:NADPH:quinone reductase-like Zn-dependent oxidoreductase